MTGKEIMAFDLEPPTRLLSAALYGPHNCRVCGLVRRSVPLRTLDSTTIGGHAACDRRIAEWERRAAIVDQDPDYLAAVELVDAAQAEADRIWEAKLRASGLPNWLVDLQLARHNDPEW